MSALLFDMDGVILEGPRTLPGIYDAATDDAIDDLAIDPTAEHRDALGAHASEPLVEACSAVGVDPTTFLERKHHHACRRSHERIRNEERGVYDDVDALASLAETLPLALVSNNRHGAVEFVAEYLDVPFDAVQGREPTPEGFDRRKPDPYYVRRTLDRLGVEAGMYVGDRATDVEAALAVGLDPAFVRRSHNSTVPTPEGTVYELDSLFDLVDLVE